MVSKKIIGIIGLGYVGLPLAHAFSFKHKVIGYDINEERINELRRLEDSTLELDTNQLAEAKSNQIIFTSNDNELSNCSIFIITVPTPVDSAKKPDLKPIINASKLVGKYLKIEDIVIYESTVYPGATEEICVPILCKESGLVYNQDFFCGYSPERINPGDKIHTLSKIVKVTSGSNPEIAEEVNNLYKDIIDAGTYMAPSIRVAEAAKVIENTQRDINIAFVNELAILFSKMDIDTISVLKAAETKWNFLPFRPGLVGGHCIGVDPFYLTYKAQQLGYNPEIILAGRRMNDNMGSHIANRVIKMLLKKNIEIKKSKVLIYGITFKENCPDIRNSKVIDIYNELVDFGCNVDVADYFAKPDEVERSFNFKLTEEPITNDYDAIIMAVAHDKYKNYRFKQDQIIFDVKSILPQYSERL